MKVFGSFFENVKSEGTLGNVMLLLKMKLKILKSGHQRLKKIKNGQKQFKSENCKIKPKRSIENLT